MKILFGIIFISLCFVTGFAQSQKGSSVVIHDTTKTANGGENATQNLRNEIESALEREKPCVETMDDQDIRNEIEDERERALLEGGDSNEMLKNLGNRMNASYVMGVSATPGPSGSVVYTVFVMDTKTAKVLASETGTDAKQLTDKLMQQLSPYLAENCKPHWVGTIEYVYSFNESKQKTDKGAMRAASRNTTRTLTETSNMQTTIKASLLPPDDSKAFNTTKARVSQKVRFTFEKKSSTKGELLCREPGKNPYFKGFSEEYTETTTQVGRGTDMMPVFILLDDDGSYSIKVTAPGGILYGKVETNRSASGCGAETPAPTIDAQSLPEDKIQATSFDAVGRTDSKNRDSLSGSLTLPDGYTKITWKLRLVKPKGKN